MTAADCGLPSANEVVADTTSVLSSAVPTAPPTCWEVLTMAEAMPESRGSTPSVAPENTGANVRPKPTPSMISDGSTWLAYEESTPVRVSSSIATDASTMPVGISGRGPVRASSRVLTVIAVTTMARFMGMNATPVSIGLKPRVCWR